MRTVRTLLSPARWVSIERRARPQPAARNPELSLTGYCIVAHDVTAAGWKHKHQPLHQSPLAQSVWISQFMWHDSVIAQLRNTPVCGYLAGHEGAAEPTALSALALAGRGLTNAARQAANWLAAAQAPNGSVAVRRTDDGPCWPTSLAVLAWQRVDPAGFASQINSAVAWILAIRGKTLAKSSEVRHDPTLAAWPWVEGTHSWIEPTAMHVLALKATGRGDHPRVREAVRMLVDRQIPGGGCNYGNTGVLGQTLRPHVQPTGLALRALGGETIGAGRVTASIAWLEGAIGERTTSVSLAWGLLGLQAHGVSPSGAAGWLERAHSRNIAGRGSMHKAALLALAADAVAGRDRLPTKPDRGTHAANDDTAAAYVWEKGGQNR